MVDSERMGPEEWDMCLRWDVGVVRLNALLSDSSKHVDLRRRKQVLFPISQEPDAQLEVEDALWKNM